MFHHKKEKKNKGSCVNSQQMIIIYILSNENEILYSSGMMRINCNQFIIRKVNWL